MREQTLKILAGVTGVTVLLALVVPGTGGSTTATRTERGPALTKLRGHSDDVATLTIKGSDSSITLDRHGHGKLAEGWTLRDRGGYPVPAATIRPVLDSLIDLHGVEPKTARPKLYSRLDLADPGTSGSASHLITVTDAKGGKLVNVVMGKNKPGTGIGSAELVYVRVVGEARTWLALPTLTLPDGMQDWIAHDIVDIDGDKIAQIELTQPNGEKLLFARPKAGEKLAIMDLPKDKKLKSETPGSDLEMAFKGLELDDVKPAKDLKGTPDGSVHLVTFNGLTVDFTLSKLGSNVWATVAATGAKDSKKAADEITARTRGWAYQLPDQKGTTLTTKLADLVQAPAPPAPPAPLKK